MVLMLDDAFLLRHEWHYEVPPDAMARVALGKGGARELPDVIHPKSVYRVPRLSQQRPRNDGWRWRPRPWCEAAPTKCNGCSRPSGGGGGVSHRASPMRSVRRCRHGQAPVAPQSRTWLVAGMRTIVAFRPSRHRMSTSRGQTRGGRPPCHCVPSSRATRSAGI